ncbi:sulfite exporter TauE/SafE family protein [Oricola sp.]|uniref:sulfite exporter TauE/SafE family protein n=1 Tax=Oricola sp. TaxID=1979950 RepID=UPI003BAC495F
MSGEAFSLLPEAIPAGAAALLVAASLFTSAVTAAFGVGGGMIMLVLMGLFLPVSVLIPVHGVVQLGSNAGRAWHLRAHVAPRVMLPFALGGFAGALIGGSVVVELPDTALKLVLGVFVIAITWLKLPALAAARSATVFALAGMVTTALSMFLGATGPLVTALIGRAFERRQQVVANSAIAMTTQHLLKVVVFGILGFALAPWLPLAAAMIATGYLGTRLGARLLGAMHEGQFRVWFRIGITLLALEMIRRAVVPMI